MGNIKSKTSGAAARKTKSPGKEVNSDPHVAMANRIIELLDVGDEKVTSPTLLSWVVQTLAAEEKEEETIAEGKPSTLLEGEEHFRPFDVITPKLTKVSSVDEVINAVQTAREQKTILRTAGAEHSPPDSLFPESKGGVTIRLCDDLRKVKVLREVTEDGQKVAYIRIGAGCYLGHNPMDRDSTVENSACYQVDSNGYAFPILGGMSHQSVGGFMVTGSAGGSLRHGFADVIQDIEFVNGKGESEVASRGSDLWHAVGVSMGLFGVITHVTFRLPERYLVKGIEKNVQFANSTLGPAEDGKSRVEANLKDVEYYHINWFSEKYVDRVLEWTGEQVADGSIVPYHHTLQNPLASLSAAGVLKTCNTIQQMHHPCDLDYKIMALLLKQFVPLNKSKSFCDLWYKTLPNDNQAPVDTIIKVDFTEIWIPMEKCQEVIDILQEMFLKNPKSAGSFAVEIYGAKASPFWMSMSHGRDVIRVDPYWWHYNEGNIRDYYAYYWDALLGLEGARLHWGKWLPLPGQKCGDIVFNKEWMVKVYPQYEEWMKLRGECDPDQVFVSSYWRNILSIPSAENTEE